jgi:hypothetical protein
MRIFSVFALLVLASAVALPECEAGKASTKRVSHANEIAAARKVAVEWLGLIDAENYSEAYDQCSDGAKRRMKSKEKSVANYQHVRKPYGAPSERRVVTEKFTTSLPTFPKGEYVLIDFLTDFQNKKHVREEVLVERAGKKWVVSGFGCAK